MILGKNVFVSSRMDELAFERRSAFDAVYLSGLTPLLFETEPTGRDEKRMIDILVDRATFFVGIYYQTVGSCSELLGNLEPIAYELYRFLFRYCDRYIGIETDYHNVSNEQVRTRLDDLLLPSSENNEPSAHVTELRQRIVQGDEHIHGVLKDRVRLYFKTHRYQTPISVNLARMLRVFPNIEEFGSHRERLSGTTDANGKPVYRYVTARYNLFDRIHGEVERAIRKEKAEAEASPKPSLEIDTALTTDSGKQPTQERRYHWHIDGSDRRGIVFRVLNILLAEGFNIDLICAGEPLSGSKGSKRRVIVDIVAHPFLGSFAGKPNPSPPKAGEDFLEAVALHEGRKQAQRIKQRMQDALSVLPTAKAPLTIEHKEITDWQRWDHVPRGRRHSKDKRLFYSVETADVPGQILRLTEKIYFYGGNVDLLYFDSRSDRLSRDSGRERKVTEKLLVISIPEEREKDADREDEEKPHRIGMKGREPKTDCPTDGPRLRDPVEQSKFEAEVRQGLGVFGIRVLHHKDFFHRLKGIERRTAEVLGVSQERSP